MRLSVLLRETALKEETLRVNSSAGRSTRMPIDARIKGAWIQPEIT